MIQEVSYGIIPLQKRDGQWHTYVVQHTNGYWGFPKGHAEAGETPKQCAVRELYEETRLTVARFVFEDMLKEAFEFEQAGQRIAKTVYYFVAEVSGEAQLVVDQEIMMGKWVRLHDAHSVVTHASGKALCQQVEKLVHSSLCLG